LSCPIRAMSGSCRYAIRKMTPSPALWGFLPPRGSFSGARAGTPRPQNLGAASGHNVLAALQETRAGRLGHFRHLSSAAVPRRCLWRGGGRPAGTRQVRRCPLHRLMYVSASDAPCNLLTCCRKPPREADCPRSSAAFIQGVRVCRFWCQPNTHEGLPHFLERTNTACQ
jgi:hypothetical protein